MCHFVIHWLEMPFALGPKNANNSENDKIVFVDEEVFPLNFDKDQGVIIKKKDQKPEEVSTNQ